jgi:hypothetical protein
MFLSPAYTYPDQVVTFLRQQGYAVLSPSGVAEWSGCALEDLLKLGAAWNDLPPDEYLKDGGRYRKRRHSCFVQDGERLTQSQHRAHWQPLEYNALHGGMQRWFEPMAPATVQGRPWKCLLRALAGTAGALRGPQPWYLEAHQFRIDTEGGIGRPTPEGAHRDGVDLVAVFLVARENIKGGETRVFQSDGPAGQRFTLTEPWSLLLLDDARVVHETTPIQPVGEAGHRDTLVLTARAGGFQGD